MSALPAIVSDLAMILLVAGITTLLFKKLNQPLVLGYIIAGFITGPHFNLFPTVVDRANIQAWSEIGVIFLLFALGLEFSFYKLKSVGSTAFIGTSVVICGMLGLGYGCGKLLGWSHMDSIFLGGMLSMSSTAIIIKAFDDLKLRGEQFTELVFGVLIVEDIAGIVMMVILSTLAVSGGSSMELAAGVLRLVFFLILWFVLGMYLIPSFFKKVRPLMNDETLVVASIGLCLGMVVLATSMGFSSALGAFIMGSLIAEAPKADHIEELVKPIKDLFGAVFFVSVGMLVNPLLLWEYIIPVICIVLVTILGQLFFSSLGILLAGHGLHTSLRCGFSLAQIGEFSFIIASLGTSLGVTSNFLYPIIVAVSVTTTFTTPFLINLAEPTYRKLEKLLPQKVLTWLDRYTDNKPEVVDNDWQKLLQSYITRMIILITLLTAMGAGASLYLQPYLEELELPYSNLLTAGITLIFMAPLLRAVLSNKMHSGELYSILWLKRRTNHLPLLLLIFFKFLVVGIALHFVFSVLVGLHSLISLLAVLAAAYFIYHSDWLLSEYLRMESRFLVNLNEKHMRKHRETLQSGQQKDFRWFDEELHIASYTLKTGSKLIGKKLLQTNFRPYYGCNILQITTPQQTVDMPGGQYVLEADSTLLFIGTKAQLKAVNAGIAKGVLELELGTPALSLKEAMLQTEGQQLGEPFLPCAITIDEHSQLLGKTIKAANIRNRWEGLVIGLERGAYTFTNPNVSLVFEKGDLLWVLGKQKLINNLIREEIL